MPSGITYTTDELINMVKDIVTIPTSQGLFLPANFVRLMNLELHKKLVPAIKRVREDYFVVTQDTDLVANQELYRIPTRAIAGVLRDISVVDANGSVRALPRIEPEVLKSNPLMSGDRYYGYLFQGGFVKYIPTLTSVNGEAIRFTYERRPSNLVLSTDAGIITDITGSDVTIGNQPTNWTTATTFDILRADPMFESVGDDLTISAISSNVLTFDSLPSAAAVGMWVSQSGLTPVPQLPYEGALVLAELSAVKVLQSIKDAPGLKDAKQQAKDDLDFFISIITPRNAGTPKRINNRNGIFGWSRIGYRSRI